MSAEKRRVSRVAIVGSGLAGLVTAYLLQQDREQRFDVEIFESGKQLSLDSCSVSVPNRHTGSMDRIDLPMRSFAGGYYNNLKAMYDYLGVTYASQPFLLGFSRVGVQGNRIGVESGEEGMHFVHSSNNHLLLPIRPSKLGVVMHMLETAYLIIWYSWFTACCFFVAPIPPAGNKPCESFGAYIRRIRLPTYFITNYLLPPFATVTTCSHETLLNFPASDLVEYKRRTTGAPHFMVSGGVNKVQTRLAKGLNIRLSAEVIAVDHKPEGIRVSWRNLEDGGGLVISEQLFDKVVMAVPPNVIQRLFKPLNTMLSRIPTLTVQSIVHTDDSMIKNTDRINIPNSSLSESSSGRSKTQIMYLRTSIEDCVRTESIHVQPSGVLVTTTPFTPIEDKKIIQCSTFTRVLRTPQSRQILNKILHRIPQARELKEKDRVQWKNGDGNVWIVGGWCWDGMVLLEGCVASAITVADDLQVRIPWRK